jgi:hypothetical protein
MSTVLFTSDWQEQTRGDLIAAGWEEIFDALTQRVVWKLPGMPGEYGFEGAKYCQGVLNRRNNK